MSTAFQFSGLSTDSDTELILTAKTRDAFSALSSLCVRAVACVRVFACALVHTRAPVPRNRRPARVRAFSASSSKALGSDLRFPAPTGTRTGIGAARPPGPVSGARGARGEGIPPVSDASFTKETHTRSLTQLPISGNMRQWTEASRTSGELHGNR